MTNGSAALARMRRLAQQFDAIFLDNRIREDVVGDGFEILKRLLASDGVVERDLEILALTNAGNSRETQAVQSGADGLALRVEHRGLEGDEDACFHRENSIIA